MPMRASQTIATILALALAAGVALALAWLSIPRMIAALVAVPGDSAVFALTYDPPASNRELEILLDSRAVASEWAEDPAYDRESAMAALILAHRTGYRTDRGRVLLQLVEEHAAAALARAPADPETWAHLAEARLLRSEWNCDRPP